MGHPLFRVRVCVTLLSSWLLWPIMCAPADYIQIDSSPTYHVGGFLLYSSDTAFAASYHAAPSGHAYLSVSHVPSKYVVWMANRDRPARPSDPLLLTGDGISIGTAPSVVWSTPHSTIGKRGTRVQMMNSGNLVLLDASDNALWQSFDYPTDTLLSGQSLTNSTRLVSSKAPESEASSGFYTLSVQSREDLVLTFHMSSDGLGSSDPPPFIYWSMLRDSRLVKGLASGPVARAVLNSTQLNLVHEESMVISSLLLHTNPLLLCRATLEADGNLRVYAFSSGQWSHVFSSIQEPCDLPLACGHFGLCNAGLCTCPGSLLPLNSTDITYGCKRPSVGPCTNSSSSSSSSSSSASSSTASLQLDSPDSSYFEMVGSEVDYFANKYTSHFTTPDIDACKDLCARNCSTCNAFFFYHESKYCYLYPELATVQSSMTPNHSLYLRTVALPDQTTPSQNPGLPGKRSYRIVVLSTTISGGCVLASVVMFIMYQKRILHCNTQEAEGGGEGSLQVPGMPTRFAFKSLQEATDNFSRKLGAGAFGSVYEGTLPDGTRVAVKQLEFAREGWTQFRAEVATIGRIHHVNLVRLHGFCAEAGHRLLVYEFMANGSLDRHLFPRMLGEDEQVLDWTTRYKIVLGTARGLAYLHSDCRETIVHCDVKPENILLDESFNAKVSDFGLAKLLKKEEEVVFSTLRGTRGYLAPEWLLRLPVSEKSDTYSFGMVLLEIVGGRKNYIPADESVPDAKSSFFPTHAFEQCKHGRVEDLLDARLVREAITNTEVERVVRIALWCIQAEAAVRPSMANVVKMLEGSMDVPMPLLSPFYAPTPSYHGVDDVSAHSSRGLLSDIVDYNNIRSSIHEGSIAT